MATPTTWCVSPLAAIALLLAGCHDGRLAATAATAPALAVPRAQVPPRVDAGLDDPAWADAAMVPSLAVSPGPEGIGLSPAPTEVRLLWDPDWLYLRFICQDGRIDAPFPGHDAEHARGDQVAVLLDAKGDGRAWIQLQVTPTNATADTLSLLTAAPVVDAQGRLDRAVVERDWWTFPAWELEGLRTAAHVYEQDGKPVSWVADLAIPAGPALRRLGLAHFQAMALRANLLRYDWLPIPRNGQPRTLVAMGWAPAAYGSQHLSPGAMGLLTLVDTPSGK
jgi:hypothetical protein